MITLEDWALIRRLVADGVPKSRVAAELGISRTTVYAAVDSTEPPRYERSPRQTNFTPYELRVRSLLAEFPRMPATVIAERVGWQGSSSWFRENVARLRPEFAPKDPADRLCHPPGEQIQCDLWFPPVRVPLSATETASPPVLVMVASYSRYICAIMLPSRRTCDLVLGMWMLLEGGFGAVPRQLLWDNEAGIGRHGKLVTEVAGLVGTLATRLTQARPYDPETKGIVERANRYLETSFLPGRSFSSPNDFNGQLAQWLEIANLRRVRALSARPADLIAEDRRAMTPLPPVPPEVGERFCIRLPRDYYVRVGGNDYSVSPDAISARVEVRAGLDTVECRLEGRLVARHERHWGRGHTISDPAHVALAVKLREKLRDIASVPALDEDDLACDLGTYDLLFGLEMTR